MNTPWADVSSDDDEYEQFEANMRLNEFLPPPLEDVRTPMFVIAEPSLGVLQFKDVKFTLKQVRQLAEEKRMRRWRLYVPARDEMVLDGGESHPATEQFVETIRKQVSASEWRKYGGK
jgi:hypothetical protein